MEIRPLLVAAHDAAAVLLIRRVLLSVVFFQPLIAFCLTGVPVQQVLQIPHRDVNQLLHHSPASSKVCFVILVVILVVFIVELFSCR